MIVEVSEGGAAKVSKGILVVMKATDTGKLYKLDESTQINETTMVSEEENEYTHLWHQQLGHMSKKGIHPLINYKSLLNLKYLNLNFCKHCIFGK